MDEFELICRYFRWRDEVPPVVTGVGDDGAVIRPPDGRELVTVLDTMVEGTHFPSGMPATDIGYRAVAINLSDLAAMGARPRWMTLGLTLVDARPDWLQQFADGMREAAGEWQVQLVGGDTTRGDHLVISVQMAGDVEPGSAILRSGARPGDTVFVTGTLGDAAAGLQRVSAGTDDELTARFARPSARVAAGLALAGTANAAIDVSDGLVADLGKLAAASGVGVELDIDLLPLSTALVDAVGREDARRFALGGGDDYELCFALSESSLPHDLPCEVTAIGRVIDGAGVACLQDGAVVPVEDSGYRHFR